MEERSDGLVITDYKTGKAPPERYAIPAFFALKIYALLIRETSGAHPGGAAPCSTSTVPTVYEIPIVDAQLDAMARQLEALWNANQPRDHRRELPHPTRPPVRLVRLPRNLPGIRRDRGTG